MGGRLRLFLSQWRRITDDVFVLSVVAHGFIISPSQDFPGVLRLKTVTPRNPLAQAKIEEEITSLLQKCAIVKVDDRPHLSLSPIFVIPKKSGGLRVILNLKRINVVIPPQHFRMESLTAVLPQLHKEDWAVTLDLQDAYLHVPIHPSSRHLLCFAYKDQVYHYQVLPFGLKGPPWVFTRLVAVLIASLRQSGVRIFHYLDDWLLVASSRTLLELHLQKTLELTRRLGFLVNLEKFSLTPSQIPSFLGASLDIPRLLARPLPHRVEALQSLVQEITVHWFSPAKTWQMFLGHLASFTDLIPLCRLFMRPLQLHFLKFFSPRRDIPSRPVPLSQSQKSLSSVVISGVPSAGQVLPPSSASVDVFRHVQPRMGSFSTSLPCVRRLVSSGGSPSHQLARASSSFSSPSEFRRSDLRTIDPDSIRQLHGGFLYQQSGRDSLPLPLQSHVSSVGLVSGER